MYELFSKTSNFWNKRAAFEISLFGSVFPVHVQTSWFAWCSAVSEVKIQPNSCRVITDNRQLIDSCRQKWRMKFRNRALVATVREIWCSCHQMTFLQLSLAKFLELPISKASFPWQYTAKNKKKSQHNVCTIIIHTYNEWHILPIVQVPKNTDKWLTEQSLIDNFKV